MDKKDFKGALIRSKGTTFSFAATVYLVWKSRNEAIFAKKKADVAVVTVAIQRSIYSILYSLYPIDHITF